MDFEYEQKKLEFYQKLAEYRIELEYLASTGGSNMNDLKILNEESKKHSMLVLQDVIRSLASLALTELEMNGMLIPMDNILLKTIVDNKSNIEGLKRFIKQLGPDINKINPKIIEQIPAEAFEE